MNPLMNSSHATRFAVLLPVAAVLAFTVTWALFGRPTGERLFDTLIVAVVTALVFTFGDAFFRKRT
jgi:hypothetical protein